MGGFASQSHTLVCPDIPAHGNNSDWLDHAYTLPPLSVNPPAENETKNDVDSNPSGQLPHGAGTSPPPLDWLESLLWLDSLDEELDEEFELDELELDEEFELDEFDEDEELELDEFELDESCGHRKSEQSSIRGLPRTNMASIGNPSAVTLTEVGSTQ